jgi:GTP-binding protein EngB required for normal cell division/uncharacterized protein (DUF697 family)
MPNLFDIRNIFETLREVDLNAIREQAEAPLRVLVLGGEGVGKSTLIAQLLTGVRPDLPAGQLPLVGESRLGGRITLEGIDLVLLVLDATRPIHPREREAFDNLTRYRLPLVVCYNKADLVVDTQAVLNEALEWSSSAQVVAIAAPDRDSLLRALAQAVLALFRGREVALARHLPLLREAVCRKLIDDACLTNATYSLSTGLAEIVPVLDIPLNVGDTIVLTKNQALLAYKIALAVGMDSDWRKTVPELAAVVGGGFLWRQIGRGLVGLIPVWGIVPKVGVAYAGTYVTGQAVYQWCVHGEKLNQERLKQLYAEAFERGKHLAQSLRKRAEKKPAQPGEAGGEGKRRLWRLNWPRWKLMRPSWLALPAPAPHCRQCGNKLPKDARFCAHCGAAAPGSN